MVLCSGFVRYVVLHPINMFPLSFLSSCFFFFFFLAFYVSFILWYSCKYDFVFRRIFQHNLKICELEILIFFCVAANFCLDLFQILCKSHYSKLPNSIQIVFKENWKFFKVLGYWLFWSIFVWTKNQYCTKY